MPVEKAASRIARAIDDEITWHLGNHLRAVSVIDDDARGVTVGELLGQLTLYAAVMDNWDTGHGRCPIAPAFVVLGDLYESLTTQMVTGSARQARRRSHGAPPITEPRRIGLIASPPPPSGRAVTAMLRFPCPVAPAPPISRSPCAVRDRNDAHRPPRHRSRCCTHSSTPMKENPRCRLRSPLPIR
ncbi:hypothetical protein [Nocardia noduli]|uniref:hypothetical protein n=1 Tax=Nocardia noduli TaxID=2815722 RepID=UPI001C235726|nr:hypothetical protein [Nocardia noduli]